MGPHAPAMGLSSPHDHGGRGGSAATSAAARLSSLATAPGAVSAARYGNGGGSAAAVGSVAVHQTPLSVAEQHAGSSAYAPFCGPHAHRRPAVPQGVAAASFFARRGPVDDEDDEEELNDAGGEERTPHGSPGPESPHPMTGVLSMLPMHKKRRGRGANTSSCSPPSSSLTRRGGPPGAGGAAAGAGAAVASGASAVVGGSASQQPRASSLTGTCARLPARGAISPRTRGTSAVASGATPPARAGGASSPAAVGASSSAGLVTVAHVNDIVRTTGIGFSGVRREITTQRKEVAILNSQLRAVTKKVDDIAVLADRLTSSLLFQRRTLVSMSGDVTSLLSHNITDGATGLPRATGNTGGSGAAGTAGRGPGDNAQAPVATEKQDAQWVLDLKVWCFLTGTSSGIVSGMHLFWCRGRPGFLLHSVTHPTVPHLLGFRAPLDLLPHRLLQPKVVEFLLHKFGRPRGPADVWVDISDVNVFMQK